MPSSTRTALLSSWEAANRQAERDGAVTLNAVSFAGFLLKQAGGCVPLAIEFVPVKQGSLFYARVLAALQSVEAEERTPAAPVPTESSVRAC